MTPEELTALLREVQPMTPEEKIAAALATYHAAWDAAKAVKEATDRPDWKAEQAAQAIYQETLNRAYDEYKQAKREAYQ